MNKFDNLGLSHPAPNMPDHHPVIRQIIKLHFGYPDYKMECVEVGTWVGGSALVLAEFFDKVYCVDTFDGVTAYDWLGNTVYSQERILSTFYSNVKGRLFDRIIPLVGKSSLHAATFPFEVDMVWIDGDHSYEGCKADILGWMPHVKDGGIMAFHDYDWHPGTTKAVDEILPHRTVCDAKVAYVVKK